MDKNNFFKNYGVLDWLPKNKISESGNLNLAFNSKNAKEVVLFIEGITENGDFILDEKIIKISELCPNCPSALIAICNKAIASSPENRYQTVKVG